MVVSAMTGFGRDLECWRCLLFEFDFLVLYEVFNGPAEAAGVVCVDCFDDEKNGAGFKEDDSANEGCDTASHVDLVVEFRAWCHNGEPYDETVNNPNDAAECKDECHKPGYVPVWEISECSNDGMEDFCWMSGTTWCLEMSFFFGRFWTLDQESVSAFSIVAGSPKEFDIVGWK
jgi:hypothetical protein